jgi:hypothetical protein
MSANRPKRTDVVARKTLVPAGEADGIFDLNAAAAALDRERDAMIAMVKFAQALAGTVMQSPQAAAPAEEPPPRAPAVKRPRAQRPRPDQHTEVTWDEAMSVEFVVPDYGVSYGAVMVEQPAKKRYTKDGVDPWPGQDVLIPSYAAKPEEEE